MCLPERLRANRETVFGQHFPLRNYYLVNFLNVSSSFLYIELFKNVTFRTHDNRNMYTE